MIRHYPTARPFYGCRLLQLRITLGLSQAEVAQRAEMSTTRLVILENKRRHPSDAEVDRLADVLGVPAGAFGIPSTQDARRLRCRVAHERWKRHRRLKALVAQGQRKT